MAIGCVHLVIGTGVVVGGRRTNHMRRRPAELWTLTLSRRLLPLSEYGLGGIRDSGWIDRPCYHCSHCILNRKAKRIRDIIHSRRSPSRSLDLTILARPPDLSSSYTSCSRSNESLTCCKSPSLYLGSDVRCSHNICQNLIASASPQDIQPHDSPLPSFAIPALDGRAAPLLGFPTSATLLIGTHTPWMRYINILARFCSVTLSSRQPNQSAVSYSAQLGTQLSTRRRFVWVRTPTILRVWPSAFNCSNNPDIRV